MSFDAQINPDEQDEQIMFNEEGESRSYKFPMLQYIFDKYTDNGTKNTTQNHAFTFRDLTEAFNACSVDRPISISNFVLDLTRQDRGIESRLPGSIIKYGYDLRKKTGRVPGSRVNYNGEFVFVGVGNALHSWHHWSERADTEIW